MPSDGGYLLDNQQVEAGQRFDALSELFNASTFRHLSAVGLGPGWQVWEAGAGGPSVPTWLAEQVGPDGRVLATDIDTTWMNNTQRFEVRRHDVGVDPRRRDRSTWCTPDCCWSTYRSGTTLWPR